MTPRLFRVWLLAALASSCLFVVAQAQTPAEAPAAQPIPQAIRPTVPAAPEEMVGPLKLSDAPLELVLEMLETWTNRTILRPQALPPAAISLKTKDPLTKSEAIRAIETALNLNGIALVRMGDKFLKVLPMQNARVESPQIIEGSSLDLPPSGQIVTKLFQLQFLRVNEFLPQIATLFNQNVSAPVIFDKSNAALITDSVTTIQRIETLVQKLDQPFMSNLTPKFYSVHYAKASDLVTRLRTILQGQLQNQLGSTISYTPDDRTNQVILICDPRQVAFFDELMAKLDVKSDPNTSNEVIYLKHATSKDVATLLASVISNQSKATQSSGSVQPGMGGQQPAQPQPPVPNQAPVINNPAVAAAIGELGSTQFSSLASVMSDDRSNAIVVNGTKDDIRLIKDLVDKIDIVLAQVRIEVVICEVLLTDEASTGISTLGLQLEGNKLVGIAGTASGIGVGGTVTDGKLSGMAIPVGDFGLVGVVSLTATPRKGNSRVLSVPSITTTHNKEAKLFFGETRPVVSGSTSTPISNAGNTTSSTVTQQQIGTTVTVKPLIGNDGSVQLDIKQTISDVTGEVVLDGNKQYIIGMREMNSFNTVKSGEIIVLAGMQKENNSSSTQRLGPIPWIGDLLGTRTRSKSRSELVVFIRPTVLTNTPADNAPALKTIDTMPDAGAIRQKLDPNYVPPKTPFYKNKAQIP